MSADLEDNPKWATVDLEKVLDVVEHCADEDDCRRCFRDANNFIHKDWDDEDLTDRQKHFLTLRNKILEDFKELLQFAEKCCIEGPEEEEEEEEEEEKKDVEKPVVEEKQDTEQSEKGFVSLKKHVLVTLSIKTGVCEMISYTFDCDCKMSTVPEVASDNKKGSKRTSPNPNKKAKKAKKEIDIDHPHLTYEDGKLVPRPGIKIKNGKLVPPDGAVHIRDGKVVQLRESYTEPNHKESQTEPAELVEEGEVVEQGKVVPGIEGTGTFHYSSLDDLLESVETIPTWYACPIHKDEKMEELTSKKEHVKDTFLRCHVSHCPVFTSTKDYGLYYDMCQHQGHPWFTLERIEQMKCQCGEDPTLSMSSSQKNKNRMYLRCNRRECDLFTWWDRKPYMPVQQILMAA
ncbi:hypothetical protein AWC38_SpisGene23900 [Stylophora pistillata]|uniref:Uncharacterized protein n=1 Tax=Stylophora pistillata TaxID=50429 RepID=A0A2B4R709_STYPI|nr:hypothetical protein AWC38_SpisGene23900 [Stylophora pistillata]